MPSPNESPLPSDRCYDAIIVGAGMVGATLCWLLANAGMRVALIEAQSAPPEYALSERPAARVSALTPVSQRLLTHVGAWPLMANAGVTPYRHMQVWDAEGSGEIAFAADEAGVPVLGHIVENDVTLSALHGALARQAKASVYFDAPVAALAETASGASCAWRTARRCMHP